MSTLNSPQCHPELVSGSSRLRCHCERSAAIPRPSAKLCRPEQSEGSQANLNNKHNLILYA